VVIAGLTGAAALAGATPLQAQWWGPGAVAAGAGIGVYYGGPYPGYYGDAYAPGYAYGYGYGPAYAAYGYAPSYGYRAGTSRPHNPKYDNY
jgi:hypothetical protein